MPGWGIGLVSIGGGGRRPDPCLGGARVVLRPCGVWDFGLYVRLVRSAEVRAFLGGPVRRRDVLGKFLQYFGAQGRGLVWVVVETATGCRVGLVELSNHINGQDVEISYQFVPTAWGRGLATEALRLALAHSFDDLGLPAVIAETQSANKRSVRLLLKLGIVARERVQRFGAEQVIMVALCGASAPSEGKRL